MTRNIQIRLGDKLFEFPSFENWVNKASSKFSGCDVPSRNIICVDSKGRICLIGKHFMRAQGDGSFPVSAYSIELEEVKK